MIEQIISFSAFWATLIGGIWVLFLAMENTTSPYGKRKIRNWLKSLITKSISETIIETPRLFIDAFDRIFGDKHLTLRCFSISCVASIMVVFVMNILWHVLSPISITENIIENSLVFLLGALIINLIPDYISLYETRRILHYAEHAGIKRPIVLLVFDLIITGVIFACGFGIIGFLLGVDISSGQFWSEMILFQRFQNDPPIGILFYSTFFTSIWMYLFIASSICAKFVYSLGHIGNWIMAFLDVEKKPFQSMGTLIICLISLVFAIYIIIRALLELISFVIG